MVKTFCVFVFRFCDEFFRSTNDRKLSWKVPYIFDGTGTLTAIIKPCQTSIDDQPISTTRTSTTSPIVHVQFFGENALFSSIDFEFACRGYRISLLKKKISSGSLFFSSSIFQNFPHRFVLFFQENINRKANKTKRSKCFDVPLSINIVYPFRVL